MKVRPILFNGRMVRAILEGRKTQTRRVVKPQPSDEFSPSSRLVVGYNPTKVDRHGEEYPGEKVYGVADDSEGYICPYGVPGDRLRLLTTWATEARFDAIKPSLLPDDARIWSLFDGDEKPEWAGKLRVGRFMPSRLRVVMPLADVVTVRVERLNDISEADAIAEGVQPLPFFRELDARESTAFAERVSGVKLPCPTVLAFCELWESINAAKHPWASNPWVFVVEFRRLEAHIAQ